ncbi:MAG: hypothetical protein JST83_00935 [Bacteroidetes bacterium]|nr:hypothetical protein [Bacteroidota bacterium]
MHTSTAVLPWVPAVWLLIRVIHALAQHAASDSDETGTMATAMPQADPGGENKRMTPAYLPPPREAGCRGKN